MTAGLPDTARVRLPRRWVLYRFRWFGRWAFRRRYRVRLHTTENVPSTGPVIFCSNHIGVIDGPMLASFAPRPVHALTKDDMFRGAGGVFFRGVGQIPLNRDGADPDAIKTCVKVLREGLAVGVYPEGTRGPGDYEIFHHGAAYLAMVTGAPVVPVVMLGSREPGGSRNSLPPRGARIDMAFGPAFTINQVPWPRRREHVTAVSALLRQHLLEHLSLAREQTGRELPGPLPGATAVPTPVLDQGAS